MVNVKSLAAIFLSVVVSYSSLSAQTKRIVTYIEDVQEERKSTRWTLTEWLRIKERMKLMDVWLAMFSTPQQKFAPEFSLGYAKGVGESTFALRTLDGPSEESTRGTNEAEEMRAQFWLTNLVSGTTGLRTLDIDLGLEGVVRNRFVNGTDSISAPGGTSWQTGSDKLQTAGVNLRIFGANSQDSLLSIKGGKFEKTVGFNEIDKVTGTYVGAEMSLYLLSFLGAEGQYYLYRDGNDKRGTRIQALGFLEFFNVRVSYGEERDEWRYENLTHRLNVDEVERYLSLRLYF